MAIGFMFFGVFFCFHSLFLMLDIKEENAIAFSNIGMFITVTIIAKLLANKFNGEHRDLIDLKKNLEQKVSIRTKELFDAKNKIEEHARQKTDYFINIAHETKTPLTLISNYLDSYIKNHNENHDLSVITQNINKLKRDMVNFLDIEKISKNQILYDHNQICDLSGLALQKATIFKRTAVRKNIDFKCDVPGGIYMEADPVAVDRILNNLLDNAFKYTEKNGGIKIRIYREKEYVKLIVSDTGIGIPEEQIEHIFLPYYQLSHKKRNVQGLGMGLHITQQIIRAIGGEIGVNSQVGRGSEFILSFKYHGKSNKDDVVPGIQVTDPAPYVEINPDDLCIKAWDKNKRTIFLVEDNLQLVTNLKRELEVKYNFYFGINGKDGLDKLDPEHRPDIIISDIMMDEMDGYEFREHILKNGAFKAIPFLFLTANGAPGARLRGLSQGAVDYICKPFVMEELKEKIQSWISLLVWNDSRVEIERKHIIRLENFVSEYGITPRQKDVLHWLLQSYENRDIAEEMYISTNTVKTHIDNIRECVGASSKKELLYILYKYVYM